MSRVAFHLNFKEAVFLIYVQDGKMCNWDPEDLARKIETNLSLEDVQVGIKLFRNPMGKYFLEVTHLDNYVRLPRELPLEPVDGGNNILRHQLSIGEDFLISIDVNEETGALVDQKSVETLLRNALLAENAHETFNVAHYCQGRGVGRNQRQQWVLILVLNNQPFLRLPLDHE